MFAERKISHSRVSEEEYTQTLFWGVRAGQHYQPRHIDLLTNLLKRDRLLFVRMLLSHLLLTSTQTNRENTKKQLRSSSSNSSSTAMSGDLRRRNYHYDREKVKVRESVRRDRRQIVSEKSI